jgi:hypothetical protein
MRFQRATGITAHRREGEGAPASRLKPRFDGPEQSRRFLCPGAGRIHDRTCLHDIPGSQLELPNAFFALGFDDTRIE